MTLILSGGKSLVADSLVVCGNTRRLIAPGRSKITRCPDGSLFGAGGGSDNTQELIRWASAGLDFANWPRLRIDKDNDDGICWIALLLDGRTFLGDLGGFNSVTSVPNGIGDWDALNIALGAIAAGATLKQAMYIAIEKTVYVGGDVVSLTLKQQE